MLTTAERQRGDNPGEPTPASAAPTEGFTPSYIRIVETLRASSSRRACAFRVLVG
jgi:hypothetical protein